MQVSLPPFTSAMGRLPFQSELLIILSLALHAIHHAPSFPSPPPSSLAYSNYQASVCFSLWLNHRRQQQHKRKGPEQSRDPNAGPHTSIKTKPNYTTSHTKGSRNELHLTEAVKPDGVHWLMMMLMLVVAAFCGSAVSSITGVNALNNYHSKFSRQH